MDGLAEVFLLENLEQIRTLADPRRMRIFERLTRQPLTVTQLGEQLGDSAAKIHYHVRELERIGVIKLVETREKGGILEKYYRAVAKDIQIAPDLMKTSPPDEVNGMLQTWFHLVMVDGLQALDRVRHEPETHDPIQFGTTNFWATAEEFRAVLTQIQEMGKLYAEPRGGAEEREWMLSIIAHPVVLAENSTARDAGPMLPAPPLGIPAIPALPHIPPIPPRKRHVFTAGVMSFDRRDLERAVADGRPLAISIIGVCHFANDIPADLVELAVSAFNHRGILQASPEVRAVLQRKSNGKDSTDGSA